MDNEQNNISMEFKNNQELPINGGSKKKKRITMIVAAAAVCVLAIGGGAYAYINSKPEVKVLNGIKATAEELEKNKNCL